MFVVRNYKSLHLPGVLAAVVLPPTSVVFYCGHSQKNYRICLLQCIVTECIEKCIGNRRTVLPFDIKLTLSFPHPQTQITKHKHTKKMTIHA